MTSTETSTSDSSTDNSSAANSSAANTSTASSSTDNSSALSGLRVAVTGSTSGLGLALVETLRDRGAASALSENDKRDPSEHRPWVATVPRARALGLDESSVFIIAQRRCGHAAATSNLSNGDQLRHERKVIAKGLDFKLTLTCRLVEDFKSGASMAEHEGERSES